MKLLHSKESFRQAFSLRPTSQNWYESHKILALSSLLLTPSKYLSDTLINCLISLLHSNDTNLFLNLHPNGVIPSEAQDTPLALITKPHCQSSIPNRKPILAATSAPYPMPINLSTVTKEPSGNLASKLKSSASSGVPHRSRKTSTLASLHEFDIHSSKDSDDSLDDLEDDEDDDVEDEDSGSSLSG